MDRDSDSARNTSSGKLVLSSVVVCIVSTLENQCSAHMVLLDRALGNSARSYLPAALINSANTFARSRSHGVGSCSARSSNSGSVSG